MLDRDMGMFPMRDRSIGTDSLVDLDFRTDASVAYLLSRHPTPISGFPQRTEVLKT